MRKIAIYCRVSTEEQAQNKEGSITSQIHRLKLKVEEKNRNARKNWGKVAKIYKDEACSGKNTNRPEFQQMLMDVRAKKINTIMVTELSRLSRSVTDFLNFIKELEDCGCDFICPQYDFDTTSPAGKVFMTIIMALAQFERELTAERIKNNFYARALRGLLNGGTPFLGYDKHPKQAGILVANAKEAELVKEIFDQYLQAKGLAEVANGLNERGIKNKSWTSKTGEICGNKPFNSSSIFRTLTNYVYIGKREVNKMAKNLDQDSLKPEERYCVVDAGWDGIIPINLFEAVQEKLKKNKKFHYNATYDFILSGLLTCDECGGPLCGQSGRGRNKKHFYYGHSHKTACKIQRYDAPELEKVIKKKLFSLIQSDLLAKQFCEIVKEQVSNRPELKKELIREKSKHIEEISLKIERLTDIMANNPDASGITSLLSKIAVYEGQLKQYEQEREKLKEDVLIVESSRNISGPELILANVDKLRKDNFRKAKLAKKRAILKEIIKSIHVHPENVIKVDFWASPFQSDSERKESLEESGVVLPFQKMGRPLEASFRRYASKGDGFASAHKVAGLGIYVQAKEAIAVGELGDEGLSVIANGRSSLEKLQFAFPDAQVFDFLGFSPYIFNIKRNVLHQKYLVEGLSATHIAEELGVSKTIVRDRLRKYGLNKNTPNGKHRHNLGLGERIEKGKVRPHKGELRVVATIVKMHREEGLSARAIARILNAMKTPTKRQGKKWDHSVVIDILKRERVYKLQK